MKESIFFNREQLRIIRRYGIFYSVLLKYGLFIFSAFCSLFLSWGVLASGYAETLSLGEEYNQMKNTAYISELYHAKQTIIGNLSGLNAKNLQGSLSFLSGSLKGQDVLLEFGGQVLPRQISVEYSTILELMGKNQGDQYNEDYLNRFFFAILKAPLDESFDVTTNNLLELTGSLYDTFGISCIDKASKSSFVCKYYLSQFLDQFYFYKLGSKQKIETDSSHEIPSGSENLFWSQNAFDELNGIYEKIKYTPQQKRKICQGIIRYGQYGGYLDDKLTTLMRSCGNEEYTKFLSLRDFSALSEGFAVGFVDSKVYSNAYLNQYKLYSTQQLLYKQLASSVDSKAVMTSYLQFLREILIRESNRKSELLPQFAKNFSYRYNTNILSPYLKDEKSKMSKEDRSFLMSQLLSLNHGDKLNNFVGLEDQIDYRASNVSTGDSYQYEIDLEKLFRSSYLPNNFSLTSLQKLDENQLLVKGIDRKTTMTLEARMIYQDIQFSVSKILVEDNQKLTEYMNALILNDRLSLNKVLNLLYENKDIADQTEVFNFDLCTQLRGKFEKDLISCTKKEVEISRGSNQDAEKNLRYLFTLTDGRLTSLQVSDKVLELKLLKEINFSLIDATTTYYMISSLVDYQPKEEDSGFGMKEHLLTIDKFTKYLGVTPDTVVVEGAVVKVGFKIQDISFQATYNPVKNELNPISLDFGTQRRPIIVQNFVLYLQDESIDELNRFVNQPLDVLSSINSALVKRYFPEK